MLAPAETCWFNFPVVSIWTLRVVTTADHWNIQAACEFAGCMHMLARQLGRGLQIALGVVCRQTVRFPIGHEVRNVWVPSRLVQSKVLSGIFWVDALAGSRVAKSGQVQVACRWNAINIKNTLYVRRNIREARG